MLPNEAIIDPIDVDWTAVGSAHFSKPFTIVLTLNGYVARSLSRKKQPEFLASVWLAVDGHAILGVHDEGLSAQQVMEQVEATLTNKIRDILIEYGMIEQQKEEEIRGKV